MISAWLATIGVAGAFLLLGASLVRAILHDPEPGDLLSLSLPLGAGVYTWVLFVIAWAGLRIEAWTCLLAYALVFAPASFVIWSRSRRAEGLRPPGRRPSPLPPSSLQGAVIWGAFILLIVLALALSLGRAHADYDAAVGWAVKGYGIALEGTLAAGEVWGEWGLSYPLNIMLQAATFMLFGAESLPGSKTVFPLYLASVSIGCAFFLRRRGVPLTLAGLTMLFLSTNTFIFQRSTTAYANLPFTTSLILAGFLAVEGATANNLRRQLLAGLLFGVAAWTRPEASGYTLLAVVTILLAGWALRTPRMDIGRFLAPYALLTGAWGAFGWRHLSGTLLGSGIEEPLAGLTSGNFNLPVLLFIPRLFLERAIAPENWGLFLPVVGALLVIGLLRRATWSEPVVLHLVALAVLTTLVPIGIYYAVSFIPDWGDYVLTLRRDFDRAFIPAYFTITTLSVLAASRWLEPIN